MWFLFTRCDRVPEGEYRLALSHNSARGQQSFGCGYYFIKAVADPCCDITRPLKIPPPGEEHRDLYLRLIAKGRGAHNRFDSKTRCKVCILLLPFVACLVALVVLESRDTPNDPNIFIPYCTAVVLSVIVPLAIFGRLTKHERLEWIQELHTLVQVERPKWEAEVPVYHIELVDNHSQGPVRRLFSGPNIVYIRFTRVGDADVV